MENASNALSKLYEKQPPGSFSSEDQYRTSFNDVVEELKKRQPKNTALDGSSIATLVMSFQEDYGLSLTEVRRRLLSNVRKYPRYETP